MNTSANDHDPPENQPEALLHLTLAGLLPNNQKLVINSSARTAILLAQTPQGEADIVTVQQFSPNGMRVLVPCSRPIRTIVPMKHCWRPVLAHLDEARRQLREIREIALRSVRRAIGSLVTGLRAFGLRVRSVRSTGYLVEAISKTTA